ncbi:3-deoxy-manno-octulosonate cytidylyltransferase [Methylophilaceae bacterium]|nr:3-deoxy-manno-octulosonate cytidylyltransferase [Methylophilaceae bacterium]
MRLSEELRPVVAIVQARMSSTRLPGKVMKGIAGRPMLWHVVNRLKASALIDEIVVATTTGPEDDIIEEWCKLGGTGCSRGSLDDVLDRYFQAASTFGAKTIVRITSDCPVIDPALVDRAIEKFNEGGFDHVSVDSSFPDGLDAEVFSFEALKRAHAEASLASEREHVTPYIWKNTQIFRLEKIKSVVDLSGMRWTVDDERDLKLVTEIYEGIGAGDRVFHMDEVLTFLRRKPEVLKLNADTKRNEGYAKSLRQDRIVKKAG